MYLHVFDRGDLNQVVCYDPKTKTSYTLLDDLIREPRLRRTDVVLMNGTRSGREYTLHVKAEGFAGDMFLLDVLSDAQYDELMQIADQMRANALEHPAAKKLLADY